MPCSPSSARSTALSPAERRRVRQERSRPRVEALEAWLREQYAKLSPSSQVAKAIAYSLNRWDGLARFLDDGRLCMTNNAAERALRGIAVGRHNWTFAGSDDGGRRAAAIYTLIETAKLNDVDPQAWLADVLARLQDHPAKRIAELLPWNWKRQMPQQGCGVDLRSDPGSRNQLRSPRPWPDAYPISFLRRQLRIRRSTARSTSQRSCRFLRSTRPR